jgi:hypothetical protein
VVYVLRAGSGVELGIGVGMRGRQIGIESERKSTSVLNLDCQNVSVTNFAVYPPSKRSLRELSGDSKYEQTQFQSFPSAVKIKMFRIPTLCSFPV